MGTPERVTTADVAAESTAAPNTSSLRKHIYAADPGQTQNQPFRE